MIRLQKIVGETSLKRKIVAAFVASSIFPVLVIVCFSYLNTSKIIQNNVEELTHSNLIQVSNSVDVWMKSYEDILFQIYMNDEIVDMVNDINNGIDVTNNVRILRKTIRGMFYTKEYIKAITIITDNGTVVFYDLLTGANMQSSWMDSFGMSSTELYQVVSVDNNTHLFSTKEAGTYASEKYYLFHMGHRIIDYRNLDKQLGVIIVSIDENMINNIYHGDKGENGFTFIIDRNGNMVSSNDEELLSKKIIEWSDNIEERKERYLAYWEAIPKYEHSNISVDVVFDEKTNWDIVRVFNNDTVMKKLSGQQSFILFGITVAFFIMVLLIIMLSNNLMHSINKLVHIIKRVGKGELSARVEDDEKIPTEIRMVGNQFNVTLDKLQESMKKEKEAHESQKNAEIAALEAQINPHFLYNTLDTINWMAIDRDEFEISNSITSLAKILRYGIDNSNGITTVKMEYEWLQQYLYLQQTRLKNTFQCEISIPPEIMKWKIHKLLLQPFIENSILHGFEGKKGTHCLNVSMKPENENLYIEIWDNGNGMADTIVEQLNHGEYIRSEEKNCIGMENAITRIQMYYGERAKVKIESKQGEYTRIIIFIPDIGQGE